MAEQTASGALATLPQAILFSHPTLIARQMGCDFLSDLRFLNSTQRAELAQKLEKLSANAFGLHDWNDALEYMAGQPSEQSAAEAREALLRCLKNEENKK